MKRNLIFILVLLIFSQKIFSQENNIQSKNSIKFEALTNPIDSNLFLSYYWHDASRGYPIYLNPKGTEILLNEPTFMLEASSRQIPYLIYPGEKLQVTYSGKFLNFSIENNESRDHELRFFKELVNQTGNIYNAFELPVYTRKVRSLSAINKNERIINNILQKRLHLLDSMKRNGYITDSFSEIAQVVIQCKSFLDSLCLYSANKDILSKTDHFNKLIEDKTQSFKKLPFIPFQFYYKSCQYLIMAATKGNSYENIENTAEFIKAYEFGKNHFSGPAKDFALFTFLNMAATKMLTGDEKYLQSFFSECTNEQYKSLISEKLDKQKNGISVKSTDMLLPAVGSHAQNILELIKENNGKLILLDFWASWCAPCRAEMPYSKKLLSQYKESEVVGIYISVDENEADWKKANEELKMDEKLNFRFAGSNADFMNQYKIMGVPRYMIVNKNGKIINEDAPRPSDPTLKELLDKALINW